ncbi:alpha amylase C-terminal domain-containing protein [Ferruginibacter sp.]|uniref:alpha amylase C-terminal domain-containing protein n=1 Tax=Ferruginibacter sp. TaxID=1940288 RepID=UPI00199E7CD0|nr:alpha amylase C-terminal domain-containing protein [Ferruginibacter sp.]MBC7627352.1 alpha amylase C-terminal domain-containing protein [Ferruginibacter sp.]
MNQVKKLDIIEEDPWLDPYDQDANERFERYEKAYKEIEGAEGSLLNFAKGHYYYGIHFNKEKNGWTYREWAPDAHNLYLTGDFNEWNRTTHPLDKNNNGDWEIFLPYEKYKDSFVHGSKVKVTIRGVNGLTDRIPAYIRRVIQDTSTHDFSGQLWFPEKPFDWTDSSFDLAENFQQPIIYECHVGMAQEEEAVGTYREFADKILPRIKEGGYNAIQTMAIQEHPYYGSFGYHVSNFFCPSSRFGTPEDLKYLVNKAHSMGITVIMDMVHSHAVKNLSEGLNEFDGTSHQYFHPGARGYHDGWDSKLFDYGKWEVKKFLLSNVRYWLEEFHFDGYRFDGVTSMLYFHHGNTSFDHYDKYFKEGVDPDAVTYLQLANEVIHQFKKNTISIAEDVSGMPGLCRRQEEGGVGFDFRLGMGIPDYWIKILKHKQDEEWDINEMWNVLGNRRYKEKTIAYAESHDQALVGDKTIAFWLMDKEMYFHMHVDDHNLVIDRGIALHKMIRLFTISLGGEAYLNFIGNEFGHPEWVDFPREGNNWSHSYARRQWSLADNKELKYQYLANWDKAMINTIKENKVLASGIANQLHMDSSNNVIVFERGNLIFIFNFSPGNSIFGYQFRAPEKGLYKIILNSDKKEFGGFERVEDSINYPTDENKNVSIYLTNRTALVMKKQ